MVQQIFFTSQELPPDLKCQILAFLRLTWPEGFTGDNRLRDWISPESDHPVHLVLVDAGVLIAHTQVVWKELAHARETYKAYGLSGVFTYPAFRGQGFGRRIVQAGSDYLQASDADVGMFHCDPSLKDFYAGCGWIAMEGARTFLTTRDGWVVSDELLMMRFVSDKGRRGRTAFEREPVYFGDTTW